MVQLLRLRGYGGGVWRRISKNALTGLNLLELCKLQCVDWMIIWLLHLLVIRCVFEIVKARITAACLFIRIEKLQLCIKGAREHSI